MIFVRKVKKHFSIHSKLRTELSFHVCSRLLTRPTLKLRDSFLYKGFITQQEVQYIASAKLQILDINIVNFLDWSKRIEIICMETTKTNFILWKVANFLAVHKIFPMLVLGLQFLNLFQSNTWHSDKLNYWRQDAPKLCFVFLFSSSPYLLHIETLLWLSYFPEA